MDTSTLVSGGQELVRAMDAAGFSPQLAMWVHTDTDTWKLWLVPPAGKQDKSDFYRRMVQIISKNREKFGGIDASDTTMVLEDHPAMQGLGRMIKLKGLGSANFQGNLFNGYYLPDGIIIRSDI